MTIIRSYPIRSVPEDPRDQLRQALLDILMPAADRIVSRFWTNNISPNQISLARTHIWQVMEDAVVAALTDPSRELPPRPPLSCTEHSPPGDAAGVPAPGGRAVRG